MAAGAAAALLLLFLAGAPVLTAAGGLGDGLGLRRAPGEQAVLAHG